MGPSNKLQFAITREDPLIEKELIIRSEASEVLLVCSAGDTILALRSEFPEIKISAFDFNPIQINHLKEKSKASDKNLHQNGNFESLFRQWRRFFNEFILSPEDTLNLFLSDKRFNPDIFNSKYWAVSFDLHFHDSFLETMFGSAAIQHAPAGSYPRYFQKVFERGLKLPHFQKNPFLQHIFLDRYLDMPPYLNQATDISQVELIVGSLFDVPNLERFDLIQLSNIFDWSSHEEILQTCQLLNQKMKPGSTLLLRQINNESPIEDYLGPQFISEQDLAGALWEKDRSLFYSKLIICKKKV